ncbi:PAS domain-containing sensor histidine kinase [Natronomonas sp. LN261]|uniref:PAS domain-containing protein n=1 Tax=Natronomonas sp. LN261 TaxID=2750669 RepID=UPI0015EECE75|nr:PAS domain-containing sensor histidine kinase [Natronomonas sp. LN261]
MGPTENISDEARQQSPLPEGVVREIYHSVNDAIFVHAVETGEILDVNETMCEMYGYSRAEARQLSIEDLSTGVPPYTQDTAVEYVQKAAEGHPQVFDWHATDSEGDPFWVEVSMRRTVFNDQTLVLVTVRDITDHRHREHELKELLEEYETTFENIQDAVFLIDVDTTDSDPVFRFERLNPSHESTSGLSSENIQGKTPRQALGDETGAEVEANYRRCVNSREPISYEEELPMPDGRIIWQTKLAPVIVNGEVTRIVGIARDITDRSRREHELRRFRQAADSAGHAVYFTDRDGTIEYVNPAFESITGYSADEAVGSHPRILQSGEMPDGFYEDLWDTLLNGNVWEGEVTDQRQSGEQYTARQTIVPIKADDEIDGYIAIQTDISDRKALETDLKTSLTQLKVMDRVLRHNLRNDMTVIKGNAETIQATSEGDVAEMAGIIIEESKKLLTTARKEREITNVLADEQSPGPTDLGAVIEATVVATREQYPDAHITAEGTADRQVRAIDSINRALTELLTNAVNHSDQTEPSIEVTVENRDDAVDVRVADDGPGIPEMEQRIITEDAEIEPLYHGTGLGLWLVKMIVENSGGSLAFNENEPWGSIVTITFPVASTGGPE